MEDLAQRIIYKWNAGGKKPMLVGKPGCGAVTTFTGLICLFRISAVIEVPSTVIRALASLNFCKTDSNDDGKVLQQVTIPPVAIPAIK